MAVDPITLGSSAGQSGTDCRRDGCHPGTDGVFPRSSPTVGIAPAGFTTRTTVEVIIQGPRGLPNFIYVMEFTVRSVIEWVTNIAPGDVYIVNDPYLGGTHLMDVKMVKPFFYRGQLDRLPGDEWALAGHRRTGTRRLLDPGNRGLPGRAAPPSGADHGPRQAQSGRARHHPAERACGHRTAGRHHRQDHGPQRRYRQTDCPPRPLRKGDGVRRYCRDEGAFGAADALPYRDHSRRNLCVHRPY